MLMMSCTGSARRGFWGFEKKSVSGVLTSEKDGWLSELAEALWQVPHVVWGRWKHRHRKIVPLSSLCRKTFKLKGNKKFCTWTKKFGIPVLSIYVRYEHSMYISHIHVWLCNTHIHDLSTIPKIDASRKTHTPPQKKKFPAKFEPSHYSNILFNQWTKMTENNQNPHHQE